MTYLMCLLNTAGLQVYYAPDKHCLYSTWRGRHDAASIRDHNVFIGSCLRTHGCRALLSDHQQVCGDQAAMHTVVLATLARLAAAGVQRIAWVPSAHTKREQAIMQRTCQAITQVRIVVFASLEAAQAWLHHV